MMDIDDDERMKFNRKKRKADEQDNSSSMWVIFYMKHGWFIFAKFKADFRVFFKILF